MSDHLETLCIKGLKPKFERRGRWNWKCYLLFTDDMWYVTNNKRNVQQSRIQNPVNFQKILFCLLHWKPFKSKENAFYFILKALFVLQIFKCLSWHFGRAEKQLDLKDRVNFKIYHVTSSLINHQAMKSGQLIEYKKINIFLQNSCKKLARPLYVFFKKRLYIRWKQVVCWK